MGHEQPGRTAVLGVERLAVVLVGDPRLATGHVLEGQIGRVAAVATRPSRTRPRWRRRQQRVDRDARPDVSSLDHLVTQWMSTVIVSAGSARSSSHGQDTASSTAPSIGKLHSSNRRVRSRAGREHREIAREVLPRRDPGGIGDRTPPAREASADGRHHAKRCTKRAWARAISSHPLARDAAVQRSVSKRA